MSKERIKPLTPTQRKAIIERDEYQSQMRHYNEEQGWHTGGYCEDGGADCDQLHVHHIKPRRKCETQDEADAATNLITVYTCEHTGVCKLGKIKKGIIFNGRKNR